MCRNILKRRALITDLNLWADDLNLYLLECSEFMQVTEPITIKRATLRQMAIDRLITYFVPRLSLVVGFAPLFALLVLR